MNDLIILPTYSEDSAVVTLIISREDNRPLTKADLADALQAYLETLDSATYVLRN